jgi:hypothetical protein
MDRLENRVRVLETQLGHYRLLTRALYLVVGLVLVGCAAFVISNLLQLREHMKTPLASSTGLSRDGTLRVSRLEVLDGTSTRPVCVLAR